MFAKAVVQAWLGAALASRVPESSIWGGSRQSPLQLAEGDPLSGRLVLLECVGSVPMRRVARSSRINKRQVLAYCEEELFAPWSKRIFFVLGHPPNALPSPPLGRAADYLRCMVLCDVADHIRRGGRGTINSGLLELLGRQPSTAGPHAIAMTLDQMLNLVGQSVAVAPSPHVERLTRASAVSWGFDWMGRPMPVCVNLPLYPRDREDP